MLTDNEKKTLAEAFDEGLVRMHGVISSCRHEAEVEFLEPAIEAIVAARLAEVQTLADGLPGCEGWMCQSCGADNFIPDGFTRVLAGPVTDGSET